ncbi:unnamed protein product [Cladocopium goreaui]|uniref:Uncharacterized protein n=2 Tax=Cladocopium goreaui TaxID=2562237 RepID=A0A9P1FN06_9DINO|nr:unnamed protein product [Cladocopium goreaui]
MGSHVDTSTEVPKVDTVAETPDAANATANSSRAPGTGEAVPYGVPGATPTHVEGVASPKASPKPSPRDEAASLPSSDAEAADPADKRAAETGDEPPAKKSRLHKEIRGLVKVVKDVVIGLTASTSTLDRVDQVSAKYFLTSMQQHSTSMNNISWQVTGSKSQVNPTLKELCRDLNDKINTGNRRLDEIKQERRSQHEQSLQYLKGIESAVDRMVTALTQLNVVTAAPIAPTGAPVGPGVASTGVPVGPSVAAPGVPVGPTATGTHPAVGTATHGVAGTMNPPLAPPPMGTPTTPGIAAKTGPSFPPVAPASGGYAPPHAAPAVPAAPFVQRAGRIRLRTQDGTEIVRAVSPNPARREAIPAGWAEEYGMGTLQLGQLVYRVISDEFIPTAVPLN